MSDMHEATGGSQVEGVYLPPVTLEVIAFLQTVFDHLEAGTLEQITGDPFYERSGDKPSFSDEDVTRIIAAIDDEFAAEIRQYAGYHHNRSGATTTPDFHRLPASTARVVVERIDEILQRHRDAA